MLSQIKDIKHVVRNFHFVAWVMPQVWDLWMLGVKNFSVGIWDGAPSTARSSVYLSLNFESTSIFAMETCLHVIGNHTKYEPLLHDLIVLAPEDKTANTGASSAMVV